MANLDTNMHVHITWDSEPTEEAKNFIRAEVLKALKDIFEDGSWFKEYVQAHIYLDSQEVAKAEDTHAHHGDA